MIVDETSVALFLKRDGNMIHLSKLILIVFHASVTSQDNVTKLENTNFSNNTSQEHVTKSEDTNFSNLTT